MYGIIYFAIAAAAAISVGTCMYRQYRYYDSFDYLPAIAAGILWPIALLLWLLLWLLAYGLDRFKDICIKISDNIDEVEEKRHLESKAAGSTEP